MNCMNFDGGGAESRTPVQRTFLAGVFKLSYELAFGYNTSRNKFVLSYPA